MLSGSCHCAACQWTSGAAPGSITACNCTLCRRYGTLWAYGHEGEDMGVTGPTRSYRRRDEPDPSIEILFCPTCAGVVAWRGLKLREGGRRRMAVNVRLAPPASVADLVVEHLDGFDTFEPLPPDGRCVRDLWF